MESQVSSTETRERNCVPAKELAEIGARIFAGAGSSANEAALIADHLVEANLVGHDSHGVIRIKKYVDWANAGQVLAQPSRRDRRRPRRLPACRRRLRLRPGDRQEAMALAAERAGRSASPSSPSAIPAISAASAPGPSSSPRPARLLPFRQHIGLRHPGGAAWRQRPPSLGQPDRRRRARRRRSAAHPRHRHLGDRRGQDPGGAQQAREDRAGPGARWRRPPDRRSGDVLRQAARCDPPLRRPQGLGPVVVLRDPCRLADRRLRQQSGDADRRPAGQQHDCRSSSIRRPSAATISSPPISRA